MRLGSDHLHVFAVQVFGSCHSSEVVGFCCGLDRQEDRGKRESQHSQVGPWKETQVSGEGDGLKRSPLFVKYNIRSDSGCLKMLKKSATFIVAELSYLRKLNLLNNQ